ncbi:DUF5955 family protein [Streptomyces griseorubiginosus]|uniref:DUF5955 family protein n=1 Tax=Streptomyces griseorubiginosus TaxID=67304 RepID=UPI00113FEB6E|nr:DUF5955 family protein [Streptomyces griseorubiginosus]
MGSDDGRQDPPVNNGVMISGGTHHVGNQAVGHRAQAFSGSVSFQPQDAGRTAELLALVERLLDEHRAALADPDATTRELRRLREELDEPEPQPTVLRRALTRLNEFVQPVTPLVVAVGQLAQSVQGLPGL